MTSTAQNSACDLLLFGTNGDLARRKLLPALYQLEKAGLLAEQTRIIGIARNAFDQAGYRDMVKQNLSRFVNAKPWMKRYGNVWRSVCNTCNWI